MKIKDFQRSNQRLKQMKIKIIIALLVLMIFIVSCGKQVTEETGIEEEQAQTDISEDISEVDTLQEDLDISELENLEKDLDQINWEE